MPRAAMTAVEPLAAVQRSLSRAAAVMVPLRGGTAARELGTVLRGSADLLL